MIDTYTTSKFPSNTNKFKDADVVVFGVPFDSTVDFLTGTRFGPRLIREAANFIEPFDMESKKNFLDKKIVDIGDITPVRGDSYKTILKVKDVTSKILNSKKLPIMLGGEHSITLGAVMALPKDVCVIVFDAHFDLKEVWEGSEYTHNTWARRGCEILGTKNFTFIGVRSCDEFELDFAVKNKIMFNSDGKKLKGERVYITVDMDCFDPSIAPGVGTPEPKGLSYDEFFHSIDLILKNNKLVGFDIAEVREIHGNKQTEVLAVDVVKHVLNMI